MVEHPVCDQRLVQLRERDRAAPLNSLHQRRLPQRLFSALESPLALPLPMLGELVSIGTLLAFVIVRGRAGASIHRSGAAASVPRAARSVRAGRRHSKLSSSS
jgi:hypothetical protein